jgi:hypothetical protein
VLTQAHTASPFVYRAGPLNRELVAIATSSSSFCCHLINSAAYAASAVSANAIAADASRHSRGGGLELTVIVAEITMTCGMA